MVYAISVRLLLNCKRSDCIRLVVLPDLADIRNRCKDSGFVYFGSYIFSCNNSVIVSRILRKKTADKDV